MIDVQNEKSCILTAQDRYDIISFAMDAADDNGFINSFIFERALFCYLAVMLFQERKDEISKMIAADLLKAWDTLLHDGTIEDMVENHNEIVELISKESVTWYQEYEDWSHSARGILDTVQSFSGDIVENAATALRDTAKDTRVNEVLEIADNWGMNREVLKEPIEKTEQTIEDSLFN